MFVDLALILIIVVFGIVGLSRGFFKTIIGFFGGLVSLLISLFLAERVANALLGVEFFSKLVLGDSGSLKSFAFGFMPEALKSITIGDDPANIQSAIANSFLKPFVDSIVQYVNNIDPSVSAGTTLATCLSLIVAKYIFIFIVGAALFLVLRILITFLSIYFNSLVNKDGDAGRRIRAGNRAGGAIVGAMQGFMLACVGFFVISAFNGASFMTPVINELNESFISKPLAAQVGALSDKYLNSYDDQLNDLLKKAGIVQDDSSEEENGTGSFVVNTSGGSYIFTF